MNVENFPPLDQCELIRDVRRDLENALFDRWLATEGTGERELVEIELREILGAHAQAITYSILRKADPELLVEAVDKVMLNLPTFRGDSLFTTWAHRVMMGVVYDQRRVERRRKEISIEASRLDFAGDLGPEGIDLLLTVEKLLDAEEWKLFQEFVLEGNTQHEVADKLNIPRTTVVRRWENVTRKLRHAFAK